MGGGWIYNSKMIRNATMYLFMKHEYKDTFSNAWKLLEEESLEGPVSANEEEPTTDDEKHSGTVSTKTKAKAKPKGGGAPSPGKGQKRKLDQTLSEFANLRVKYSTTLQGAAMVAKQNQHWRQIVLLGQERREPRQALIDDETG